MSKNIFKKIIILVVALGVLGTSQIGYAQIPIGEEIDLDLPREELLPNPTSQPNQQQPGQPQRNNKHLMDQLEGCGWGDLFSPNFACITKGIAWIAYTIFIFAAWLLAAVANVFNYVLGMTLDNANYSAVGAIKEGWAFSRDVVNLFFIFILLFIAIATILQIESYGAKKLLVWLVLVALLVNFSLIASQFIIYATNSLGILFYQSISANDSPFLSSLKIGKEGFRKDISGAFQKGLSDQTLANPPVTGFQVGPVASGDPKLSPAIINSTIIIILVAGTMLLTFAMIIFAAGAFFMVVRLAMLWLLMILAPFGFVLLILPITRSYALQWWRTLQSQALFAPAFMFFIIITIKIVQSDFVQDVSKKLTQQGISTTEFLFLLIINHIVILVLLGASLIVAKQMSMYGANAVMGTAKSFGKFVGGYAGRGALRAGAPVARYIEKGGERIGRLPLVGAAWRMATKPLAAVSRGEEKLKAERENYYKGLAPKAFASTYRSVVDPFERKLALRAGAEAGKLGELSETEIQTAYNQNTDNPKALNNILKIRPDLIEKDASLSAVDKRTRTIETLSRMSAQDIEEKLDGKTFTDDPAYALTQELMALAWGEREMAAVLRKHGKTAKDAIDRGLASIGPPAMQFDALYKNNKSFLRGTFTNPSLSTQFSPLRANMEIQARAKWPGTPTNPDEWEQKLGV
ncbi:MAG TPA: hypothetical protein VJL09_01835 [Candidatus Paceibacterota bacterium]